VTPREHLDLATGVPVTAEESDMKRVTVLVPDTIVTVFDSSTPTPAQVHRLEVTPTLIVRALTTNDYHEHVYFTGGVRVVSIEDVPEGGLGCTGSDGQ
jgi:predicted amidohydrolase